MMKMVERRGKNSKCKVFILPSQPATALVEQGREPFYDLMINDTGIGSGYNSILTVYKKNTHCSVVLEILSPPH